MEIGWKTLSSVAFLIFSLLLAVSPIRFNAQVPPNGELEYVYVAFIFTNNTYSGYYELYPNKQIDSIESGTRLYMIRIDVRWVPHDAYTRMNASVIDPSGNMVYSFFPTISTFGYYNTCNIKGTDYNIPCAYGSFFDGSYYGLVNLTAPGVWTIRVDFYVWDNYHVDTKIVTLTVSQAGRRAGGGSGEGGLSSGEIVEIGVQISTGSTDRSGKIYPIPEIGFASLGSVLKKIYVKAVWTPQNAHASVIVKVFRPGGVITMIRDGILESTEYLSNCIIKYTYYPSCARGIFSTSDPTGLVNLDQEGEWTIQIELFADSVHSIDTKYVTISVGPPLSQTTTPPPLQTTADFLADVYSFTANFTDPRGNTGYIVASKEPQENRTMRISGNMTFPINTALNNVKIVVIAGSNDTSIGISNINEVRLLLQFYGSSLPSGQLPLYNFSWRASLLGIVPTGSCYLGPYTIGNNSIQKTYYTNCFYAEYIVDQGSVLNREGWWCIGAAVRFQTTIAGAPYVINRGWGSCFIVGTATITETNVAITKTVTETVTTTITPTDTVTLTITTIMPPIVPINVTIADLLILSIYLMLFVLAIAAWKALRKK